jgi:uncharacterized cupin superfamily protein
MTVDTLLRPLPIRPDALELQPLELDPDGFQSPLPVQHYAVVFADDAIGLAVGIWDTTTMQEAFGPYPGDEFITVLDGRFAMVDATGQSLATAGEGDSVTFRNGAPSSWKQDGYLRKIYLTLQDPTGAVPDIISAEGGFRVIDPASPTKGTPDADGTLREMIFRNDAGTMTVSRYAFPAQSLPAAPCPCHRLIRVLQGTLTLTVPFSPPDAFGAGDHVFLPKGTACAMDMAAGTVAVIVDVTAD